jgi:glycosyltransferase involved in cell wall biosynthesis
LTDISVVLPARDGDPRLVWRALRSTLRSRGVAFEVVVVDHGSTSPITASDARVTVVRVARDVTFADALNAGVAVADTDVIARMDADDVMHPDRLRVHAAALAADAALSAVSSRVKVLPNTTTRMRGYVMWQNALLSSADHARQRFVEQPVCHPATTFRRAALDDVGGYVHTDVVEDYDLFLRLLGRGHRIAKLATVHHGWRQHDGQATRRVDRDAIARLKARHLTGDFGLRGRDVVIIGAGKEGRRISRALRGAGVAVRAFVDVDAKKQGRLVHNAPVHAPAWLAERPAGAFVIGAVGTSGARGAVRALLTERGLVEGHDALFVA